MNGELARVEVGLEDSEELLSRLEEIGNRDCGVCEVGSFGRLGITGLSNDGLTPFMVFTLVS